MNRGDHDRLPSARGREARAQRTGDVGSGWQIKIFFDGECPLCAREIDFLRRRDAGRGAVRFEDISDPAFDAAAAGLDRATLMARIHGQLPDGSIVEGVEVFRRVYAAVGMGWLAAPTRWPGVRQLADLAYRVFARNRLRWTGRESACETGGCRAPLHGPAPDRE